MKVLKKEPGRPWEEIKIENTLEALQAQVGGYIETYSFATDACIICDEEGRLKGKPKNRALGVNFCGTLLLVGIAGEDFCDVPAIALEAAREGRF